MVGAFDYPPPEQVLWGEVLRKQANVQANWLENRSVPVLLPSNFLAFLSSDRSSLGFTNGSSEGIVSCIMAIGYLFAERKLLRRLVG